MSEPVAYINVAERKLEWASPTKWETPTVVKMDKVPLYIKREWQGLTAKDLAEIPPSCYEGAIWADAKLKEKNGAEVITEPSKKECTPIPPATKDGWTEWQFPIHKGYLMQCCDCGLVHEVNFKVVEKVGKVKKDGNWESEPTKKGKFRVGMKMKRHT